ncbi:MAG: RNA polymerase sigma factor FliA [Deltaproteobacteria bacterium]|nr:RNA polymerase sigma factor FliA [Deltaproteobacteria bacterium]MCB9787819.1 RNA polymerase sigma factor FliA [Deltaproteobacteria bacterium]
MPPTKPQSLRRKLNAAYAAAGGGPTGGDDERPTPEEIIAEHAGLVRRVARRFAHSSGGVVDVDDLISVGIMGLLQARENYDPAGGRPFRTYAEFRIRGAILDELRRLDPMSQPQRRKVRAYERAVAELANELGREPTEQEIADTLGISIEQLHTTRRELQQVRFVSTENDEMPDLRAELAATRIDRSTLRLILVDAIRQLPERHQQVLSLYYFQDMKLKEIGEILEVTEARVCQIHKAAVTDLRAVLEAAERT